VRLQVFLVRDHTGVRARRGLRDHREVRREPEKLAAPHPRSGPTVPDDTVVEGLRGVVGAFFGVLRGSSPGKMIVQVGDPEEK